jgi:hypothetical protein
LEERYIDRCFLLEEHGPDYEVGCSLIDTTRHEFFVTREIEWLLYVSHEDSISVAGLLADFFRMEWRDWRSITCIGPP